MKFGAASTHAESEVIDHKLYTPKRRIIYIMYSSCALEAPARPDMYQNVDKYLSSLRDASCRQAVHNLWITDADTCL